MAQHHRVSVVEREELSHADVPEHFGHTRPSGHRLWVRYSRQTCGVEKRRRKSRMSFGYSGRPMLA